MGIQERIDAASRWLVYELGERGHKLDRSLEGVAALDSLIEGPTPLTSLLDVDLEPLSTAIGAFVGEVIRRQRSADWNALDWSAAGVPFPDDEPLRLVVLVVHGKGNADPIGLALARLEQPSITAFRFRDFVAAWLDTSSETYNEIITNLITIFEGADPPYEAGRRVWALSMEIVGKRPEGHPLWLIWGALTDWVENKPNEREAAEADMRRAAREWWNAFGDGPDAMTEYFDRWIYDELGYERRTGS